MEKNERMTKGSIRDRSDLSVLHGEESNGNKKRRWDGNEDENLLVPRMADGDGGRPLTLRCHSSHLDHEKAFRDNHLAVIATPRPNGSLQG